MFSRDYLTLNPEEIEAKKEYDKVDNNQLQTHEHFQEKREITAKYPAIRYFNSLFPNNFINPEELEDKKDELTKKLNDFKDLLDNPKSTERIILNYIKNSESFFIISSIAKNNSNWGNHDLYLFPEFPLGTNYKVDYLLTGKNSFGFHFMFIELENIYNGITNSNGSFGQTIRKGINQVNGWELWLEKNYNHLKPIYEKNLNPNQKLPNEFFEFDKTKISYTVVGGRREDYDETTYRSRGKHRDESKIIILHYDNVIDSSKLVLRETCY